MGLCAENGTRPRLTPNVLGFDYCFHLGIVLGLHCWAAPLLVPLCLLRLPSSFGHGCWTAPPRLSHQRYPLNSPSSIARAQWSYETRFDFDVSYSFTNCMLISFWTLTLNFVIIEVAEEKERERRTTFVFWRWRRGRVGGAPEACRRGCGADELFELPGIFTFLPF